MSITQISKIQNRTGNLADLPQLSPGELGFATDAHRLFIGNDNTANSSNILPENTEVLTQYSDIPAAGNSAQIQYNNDGVLGATGSMSPSANGIFTYDYLDGLSVIGSNATVVSNIGNGLMTVNNILITEVANIKSVYVENDAIIRGNLTVYGNTTTINVESLNVEDPIISIGVSPNVDGNVLPPIPGDRGLLMYDVPNSGSSYQQGFMGYVNSDDAFAFYMNAVVASNVVTGNLGNFKISNIVATGNISGNFVSPGSNTQVLFNDSGLIGADSGMTYNRVTDTLSLSNVITAPELVATNAVNSSSFFSTSNILINATTTGTQISFSAGVTPNVLTVDYSGITTSNITANANLQAGNIKSLGIANVVGDLIVGGNGSISGNLSVTQNVSATNGTFSNSVTTPNLVAPSGTITINGGNLIPNADSTYDLGSTTRRWRDLYVSGNSIYIGPPGTSSGIKSDSSNGMVFLNETGANFAFTGITGEGLITVYDVSVRNDLSVTSNATIGGGMSVTGNVDGGNITALGLMLANNATVSSNLTAGNANITGVANVSSNLNVIGQINAAGNLNVNGNILSNNNLRILGSANITGNATVGGTTTFTGNTITAGTFTAGNIVSQGNLNVAIDAIVAGNVGANNVTVTTNLSAGNANVSGTANVSGNITAGGDFISGGSANIGTGITVVSGGLNVTGSSGIVGDMTVTGNIFATGNITYSNLGQLTVTDPIIFIGANNPGNVYDLGTVATFNDGTQKYTGFARDHSSGIWRLFTDLVNEPNTTSIDWANSSYAPFAASAITSSATIAATGNVSGGNLTTVGRVTATGNVFGGNINTTGQVVATGNVTGNNIAGIIRPTSGTGSAGIIFPLDPGGGSGDIATIQYYAAIGEATTLEIAVANDPDDTIKLNATGGTTVTNTLTSGNLSTSGTLSVTGNATTGNLSTATAVITTGNITTINSGLMQNGTSNVTIASSGNVTINAVGGARITATSTGANVAGTLGVTGNANVGNIGAAAGVLSTLSVSGTSNLGAVGNVTITGGTSGQALVTNGSGGLTWGTPVSSGSTTQALTVNNSGAGSASGITFNGSTAVTISYNTIGASPLAGSSSLTTTGTITSGVWNGTSIGTAYTAAKVTSVSGGGGISVSSTTGAITLGSTATAANTASAIVARGSSGEFSAGAVTASSVVTANITTGASSTAGTITGAWTLTAGSKLQSTYADLGERYTSDADYESGTLVMIGGERETTIATEEGKYRLAGIVSTNPAYVLNSIIEDSVIIALAGRVPCKVVGKINKGDMLTISHIPGVATSTIPPACGTVVARALENYDSDAVGVIEVKVDRA